MPTTAPIHDTIPAATSGTRPDPGADQPPLDTCDACARCVDADSMIRTLDDSSICPTCQDIFYWQCPDCGGWNRDGRPCGNDCTSDDDGDDTDDDRDDDTDDDWRVSSDLIHSYTYKPSPVFFGTGPLFLGLELEIATPHGRAAPADLAVRILDDLGYLKADESIGGGFELVTHPMAYPWALANFPWKLLPALALAGCRTPDTTGLHVHLSRAGFNGPAHVYRWMKFVYRNQTPVTALARRTSFEWARFDDLDRCHVKDYAKGYPGVSRYRAINTQNTDTFELRIFASSLWPIQVQAALGFAAASVDYTRTLTVAEITRRDGWAWPAFTGWLTGRPGYAPLLDQVHALTTPVDGGSSCAC